MVISASFLKKIKKIDLWPYLTQFCLVRSNILEISVIFYSGETQSLNDYLLEYKQSYISEKINRNSEQNVNKSPKFNLFGTKLTLIDP